MVIKLEDFEGDFSLCRSRPFFEGYVILCYQIVTGRRGRALCGKEIRFIRKSGKNFLTVSAADAMISEYAAWWGKKGKSL